MGGHAQAEWSTANERRPADVEHALSAAFTEVVKLGVSEFRFIGYMRLPRRLERRRRCLKKTSASACAGTDLREERWRVWQSAGSTPCPT